MSWYEIGLAAGAFAGMAIVDFSYARYTRHVVDQRSFWASWYAALIVFVNATVIIGYTSHWWLILPTAAGAFVGTWAAMVLNGKGRTQSEHV